MKKVKRILSLITAIAVMLGTLVLTPVSASAAVADSDYGLLWYSNFEAADIDSIDMTRTAYTGSSLQRNILAEADELRGKAFTFGSTFGDCTATWTKNFASDISGKKLNFSYQVKVRDTLATESDLTSIQGFPIIQMRLFNDGARLEGSSGQKNKFNFMEIYYDYADDYTTSGAAHMFSGAWSGIKSAPQIGLDDLGWHQVDGVIDAETKELKMYIDGTQVYPVAPMDRSSDIDPLLDADGNFNFDKMDIFLSTISHDNLGGDNGRWGWYDNFKITNTEGTSFGVIGTKKTDGAVYLELSNTVLAGQSVPDINLRKVGTKELYAPAVTFEGSQAIKLDFSALALSDNSEYVVEYPADMNITDINGRSFDTAKEVTFYTDGEGNGVTKARLVSANSSLLIPDGNAMRAVKGMELTFEEVLTAPAVTFTAEDETVTVNVTNDGSKYTLSWASLNADYYELIVKDGDTVVYEYSLTDVLSIDPIYPEDDDYGMLWYSNFEAADIDSIDMTRTAYTGSSVQRNILAEADELRGKAFTFGSTFGDCTATWTKNFASDISGKKLNFSYQVKVRDTLATESNLTSIQGFPIIQMRLFNDDARLEGSSGQANKFNFMEIYYDYADDYTTSGAAHMFSGAWSGIKSAPQIGLDDLGWHQVDGVIDAETKELKMYIDGTQVYPVAPMDRSSDIDPLLDADGNFNFDKMDIFLSTISHDNLGGDNGRWGWYDNFKITNTEEGSFGVIGTKKTDSALYLELSNTVLAGQSVPDIKLRKVGTSEVYSPSVTFEGSQAIKLDLAGLTLADNSEYAVEYPENMNITDINGRSIDKEQMVTFYIDGAGNGVKFARLVNLDNTISIPTEAPSNAIKGIVIETEEAATNVTATLESANDTAAVSVTGAGNEWTVAWGEFLDAEEYTLTVTADGSVVYTYVFTPEVSGELSISEFAVYDAQGNEIRDWSDALRGQTLTATAHIINPTGVDKFACVSYAAYANKWLRAVSYNDNDGEAIAETFNGTPIEISFNVPSDATMVKVMLWSGMDTMRPLAPAITID